MKLKHILFAFLVIFAIGFTSCEKEPDPQLLSEFVIGGWQTAALDMGEVAPMYVYFNATINADNTYVLKMTLVDGGLSATCPATGYSIDNAKNQIIIDQPDFPDDGETPTGTQTFDVTWVEGQNTMLWTPIEGSDAPTLQWTRGD